jgi:Tol biopolymer transport system component
MRLSEPIRRLSRPLLPAILLVSFVLSAPAVHGFGKNKIVYQRFDWQVYRSIHFEIFYYPEEEEFLDQMISYAESAYDKVSKALEHEPTAADGSSRKIPLIFYRTHGEFEQTNISLAEIPEAVGAFAEPFQNRIVLPIDGPPDEVYKLLVHELTHIFEFSILYGDSLRRTLRSSPPLWIMEGLASYIAEDESNIDKMVIRDAVVNNIIPPVEELTQLSFLNYRYGNAIFDYINEDFGAAGIRNFLFEYRKVLLTNSVRKAIRDAFGIELDEFNRRFNKYLRRKYFPVLMEKDEPADYGVEIGLKKRGRFTFSPTLSPSGELVAVLATPKEELDVLVLSANDGKVLRNLTKGFTNKYKNVSTEAFDGQRDLTWSPDGDRVAFFVSRENKRDLLIYNALTGKRLRRMKLPEVDIPASPAFSPDGQSIIFNANRAGIMDLFRLDLESGSLVNMTDDNYFDTNPVWSEDGTSILYNRRIGGYAKVFLLDASDPERKTQLTFGPSSDLMPIFGRDGKTVFFVSDRGELGIYNIWSLDTTTGDLQRWTDLVGGAFAPVQLASEENRTSIAYVGYFRGTFRLYRMDLKEPLETIPGDQAPETVDVEPFKPPLPLVADASEKKPYKLRWNVDAPNITIGAADDGTIFSNTDIQFTDLLGDHRIGIRLASVDEFSNLNVRYLNLKRRVHWGARVFDNRDFFLADFEDGTTRERRFSRFTGLEGVAHYPFNRYYRVESGLGYLQRRLDLPVFDPKKARTTFESFDDDYAIGSLGFSGDTTRFKSFGAFHGKRFQVTALRAENISGDSGSFNSYQIDFRSYGKVTSRSLFAWRLATIASTGEGSNIYSLGGYNELRGYDFREFFGNRIFFTNLEFRFPLIDALAFPFGVIPQIRGTIFVDAGAAWFEDDLWWDPIVGDFRYNPLTVEFKPNGRVKSVDLIDFDPWDSENDRLQDLRASWGLGFHFLFGGLEIHWDFAHRLPYTEYDVVKVTDPDTGETVREFQKVKNDDSSVRTNFWIGFQF